jgi:Zn-finger nucleic acid-binding protein
MKCPACFNELSQFQVGKLVVDICQGGCGGIWFDAFELQQVDDEHEQAGQPLMQLQRDKNVVVDPVRKRECPRCQGVKLLRHFFSAKRKIEVDECPNCAGYWLDAGELAAIRAERSADARIHEAQQSVISGDTIRYLYKLQAQVRKGSVSRL